MPDLSPSESFALFAAAIHSRVPDGYSIDLASPRASLRRAICGEHGHVVPTAQDICPTCGGIVVFTEKQQQIMDADRQMWLKLGSN